MCNFDHLTLKTMATFSACILTGPGQKKDDNSSNIKIRITQNRQVAYISTDLYVDVDDFKSGKAKGPNASFINMRITDYLQLYQKRYLKLGDLTEQMSAKEIREAVITEAGMTDIDFIKFSRDYLEELKKDGKDGSVRAVRGFVANLVSFRSKINFTDIDLNFLYEFERYLANNGVGNGIASYMARFRVIFNKGRERYNDEDRGLIRIPNYPFRRYKIKQVLATANDNSLTVAQFRLLLNYKPVTVRESLAKDMFLLMFYLIGINSKDLYLMGKPSRDGRLMFKRSKTKRKYGIKLEPEAKAIIEKYKDAERLINVYSNYTDHLNFQKAINIGLKSICFNLHKKANEEVNPGWPLKKKKSVLDFPLAFTSNWARHTWATIARNDCSINKDDVALCLGHEDKDNQVTDIYIKYDYSIIDRSNRKVINLVTNTVLKMLTGNLALDQVHSQN